MTRDRSGTSCLPVRDPTSGALIFLEHPSSPASCIYSINPKGDGFMLSLNQGFRNLGKHSAPGALWGRRTHSCPLPPISAVAKQAPGVLWAVPWYQLSPRKSHTSANTGVVVVVYASNRSVPQGCQAKAVTALQISEKTCSQRSALQASQREVSSQQLAGWSASPVPLFQQPSQGWGEGVECPLFCLPLL